jgi:hypothetical protein
VEKNLTPDPTPQETPDLTAQPRILVAPGPQGETGSWRYHCDGCDDRGTGSDAHELAERARRHNADVHGGQGHVEVVRTGGV